MSSSPGSREVAVRLFASEFDDASLSYSESDEERAPNYVVTPTGARINRLFVAGVLTETERVNEDTLRARIVDPSGAFVTYAGQYQPDEQAFLDRTTSPEFVALTGKARTFQPEDSDRVFTSVRPESINAVDADTRDRWIVTAAETTLNRLAVFERALEADLRGDDLETALAAGGASPALAAGIPHALDHYRTSPSYVEAVRQLAVDALEMVADERDEVRVPEIAPDEGGHADIGRLPDTEVTIDADAVTEEPGEAEPEAADEDGADGSDEAETEVAGGVGAEEATDEEAASEADDLEAFGETQAATTDELAANASAEAGAEGLDEFDEPNGSDEAADTETAADTDAEAAADADTTDDTDDELGNFDDGGSEFGATETDDTADPDAAEPDTAESDAAESDAAEPDDAPTQEDVDVGGEMYEMDEEERQEIEEQFGTGFSTGSEVDEPGEADIDVPDPEELAEMEAAEGAGMPDESDSETETPAETEPSVDAKSEPETEAEAEPEAEPEAEAKPEAETEAELEAEPEVGSAETDEAETSEAEADAADVDLEAVVVDVMEDLDEGDGATRDAVVEATVEQYDADPDAVEDAVQDALMSGKCYEPGENTLKAI